MANPKGINQYSGKPKCNFRLLMESQGLTCDQLARTSGLAFANITRLASGCTDPLHINVESFLKLAKGFNMSPANLIKALNL